MSLEDFRDACDNQRCATHMVATEPTPANKTTTVREELLDPLMFFKIGMSYVACIRRRKWPFDADEERKKRWTC